MKNGWIYFIPIIGLIFLIHDVLDMDLNFHNYSFMDIENHPISNDKIIFGSVLFQILLVISMIYLA